MLALPSGVADKILTGAVAPVELLLLRKTETRPTAFLRRTNAPFDITDTHDSENIVYQSGLYPLVQAATPESASLSERSLLRLALQDVNWALRDDFLANGFGAVRTEVRVGLLDVEDGSLLASLRVFEGHAVSAVSSLDDAGETTTLSFAGPLEKLNHEKVLVVSEDSEQTRDPVGDSFKYAHQARSFRWAY